MIRRTSLTYLALQFGNIQHFNEGLSEFARQLGLFIASQAPRLQDQRGWRFHFYLPEKWHGLFGTDVDYRAIGDRQRYWHWGETPYAVWHGLHQHMRYRPPVNSAFRLVTVHDLNHLYAKAGASLWWQKMRLRRQLSGVHRLISISDFVADEIRTHLPWAPPVETIYNGVADLSAIPAQPIQDLLGRPYFFHISRMSPSKNVDALLRLAKVWPEKLFVFAGPASAEVDRHRRASSDMGLDNVVFKTDVSEGEKAWLYAHCEAFLFPSLFEGFGLPPVEAMRFGRPLFVSRRSCLPDVCGEGALYWDDFTPSSMKAVMVQGLSQWPVRAQQQKYLLARYSWQTAGQAYLDVYGRALS